MLNFIKAFNAEYLTKIDCYLSGDAAIQLLTNQFREPTELHFVCASKQGYATFVENLYDKGIGSLFLLGMAPRLLIDVKGDMYGSTCWLNSTAIQSISRLQMPCIRLLASRAHYL